MIAVKRQLKAMNCELYEIGIYHREADKMLPRVWTQVEILKSVGWLKAMNYKGHDIFIRPEGSQGLIFFDDLSRGIITKMKEAGFAPAVLIESSPDNFHGWVRVSKPYNPIPAPVATAICKNIAFQYGGDTNSADWRHYGRLAGFTNQKPVHIQENGRYPFVLLSDSNGELSTRANDLIAEAIVKHEQRVKEQKERQAKAAATLAKTSRGQAGRDSPGEYFRKQLSGLRRRYGVNLDASKADWMIVLKMIAIGYSEPQIREALEAYSPALETRLGDHADKYINVTINNAFGNG